MATPVMPLRGKRIASKFDSAESNDLICFFKQLEIIFNCCKIVSDVEKKEYTTSYISSEVTDSWDTSCCQVKPSSTAILLHVMMYPDCIIVDLQVCNKQPYQLDQDFKRCLLAIYIYIYGSNTAFWQSDRKLSKGRLQKDRKTKKKIL
jgi:hypothetical protein